jgi:hypothetical protein
VTPPPCPYCGTHTRTPKGFRDHLARRCDKTPPEVRLSIVVREARSYTEAEFQSLVVARFRDAGWMCFHAERGRGRDGDWLTNSGDKGLPDWLFIRPPVMLLIEMKRESGKPSPEQVRVIRAVQSCTRVEGYFARPSDFPHLMAICDEVVQST